MKTPSPYTLPALRETPGGVLVKVRASPGASRERVAGLHGDALKIAVTAPPEKGKANDAIRRALARHLQLRDSQVSVSSGLTSREKWLRVEGLTLETAKRALRDAQP
jgi:uncharacterized protein (TIGR00251 family)